MNASAKDLREALTAVEKLATRRTTLPILSHVLLSAKGGQFTITASDINTFASTHGECDGDLPPVCVPAYALSALLAPAEKGVKMELKENLRLDVKTGASATLACLDGKDFPDLPEDGLKKIGLNTGDLAKAIKSVVWAASDRDKSRPMLAGVCIRCNAKEITTAAFSGVNLGYHAIPSIAADTDVTFHSEAAEMLCAALTEKDSELSLSDNFIAAKSGQMSVYTKLMEGKYFDVKGGIVKAQWCVVGDIDKEPVLKALAMIQALNSRNPDGFAKAELMFSEKSLTIGCTGNNSYKATYKGAFKKFKGESLEVHCNAELLLKALASCATDSPKVSFSDPRQLSFEHNGYHAMCAILDRNTALKR